MKQIIFILIILGILIVYNTDTKELIIPNEAIRLRVIANSNSEYDQSIKNKVKDVVQEDMYKLLKDTKKIDEARHIINNNINNMDDKINLLLLNENYDNGYTINFSNNFFPRKEYKGVVYEEGYYESVKVTLGEGLGDNWWCVLFPPLCLIEAEESTEAEYKFFIKEIIDKFLNN